VKVIVHDIDIYL